MACWIWIKCSCISNYMSSCSCLCTELTPVSSVSVDYTCTNHSGVVSWSAVFGAESYRAFAMGDNGTQLTCTSQTTSCQISGLTCGQSYVVHVIPMSESCTNTINTTSATFQTGETQMWMLTDATKNYSIIVKRSLADRRKRLPCDNQLSTTLLSWVELNVKSQKQTYNF